MQSAVVSAEVFIATSLDGFIARPDGDIGWLVNQPVPEAEDFGYAGFMDGVGAIVMGRQSFEKVLGFGEWSYSVPVVVMSRTPDAVQVPDHLRDKVTPCGSSPTEVLALLQAQGVTRAYVDGGQVIRAFLDQGLIRRLIVTVIPVLIGAGRPLWGHGGADIPLTLTAVKHWPNGFAQLQYKVGPHKETGPSGG